MTYVSKLKIALFHLNLQVLKRDQYQQVIAALDQLWEKRLSWDEQTKQLLIEEQHQTDRSLAYLEVTAQTHPSQIPHVNQLFLPDPPPPRPVSHQFEIEIGGSPRAGKTTLLTNSQSQFSKRVLIPEGGEALKRILARYSDETLEPVGGFYSAYHQSRLISMKLLMLLEQNGREGDEIEISHDRGWLDSIAFLRSQFLFGRLTREKFLDLSGGIVEYLGLESPKAPLLAIVFFLVSPTTSLEREGSREEPGRVMQMPFLTVLYEQHLRLYSELLKHEKECPWPFICLDTSGPLEENQTLFNHALEEITAFWKRLE